MSEQTITDPLSLREYVMDGESLIAEIVSVRDLPDLSRFGLSKDYVTVLVKKDDEYFADTVVVTDGNKPQVGESWLFCDAEGATHALAAKVVESEAPAPEAEVVEEAKPEEEVA